VVGLIKGAKRMSYKTDKELLEALKEPFASDDLEWRVQHADKSEKGNLFASLVAYVDARAVQNRLDDVCGAGGWWNQTPQYSVSGKGVSQGITIKLPENGEVTKWDGAEETNIEAVKGGLSGAFKRAAVLWGIGRYLYDIEIAYVTPQKEQPQSLEGWQRTRLKIGGQYGTYFYKRPTLPKKFLPKENVTSE
jgi:hypothetical protein